MDTILQSVEKPDHFILLEIYNDDDATEPWLQLIVSQPGRRNG